MKLFAFLFSFFPGGSEQHRGEGQESFVSFQSILFTIKLSRNQKRLLWRRVGGRGGGGGSLRGSFFSWAGQSNLSDPVLDE